MLIDNMLYIDDMLSKVLFHKKTWDATQNQDFVYNNIEFSYDDLLSKIEESVNLVPDSIFRTDLITVRNFLILYNELPEEKFGDKYFCLNQCRHMLYELNMIVLHNNTPLNYDGLYSSSTRTLEGENVYTNQYEFRIGLKELPSGKESVYYDFLGNEYPE